KTDPQLEYETSLKLTQKQDPTFRRTFPLRYKTIAQRNSLLYEPLVTPNQDVTSVMVVFPNRYMANPASMFGHLFIILKSKHGLMDSDILHYLADTAGTSQSSYIFNGLTGKFKGWFLRDPYYKKIKDYNYVEDRSTTYYDLNLSAEQIENLQLHAVELKKSCFYYYFLDKNCAFFMGKLLNVILDEDILPKNALIFPSQIINSLYERSLLTSEYQRKASTKLFNESFNHLSQTEQSEVVNLIIYDVDVPTSNPKVLRTFLYTSEHLINTRTDLAQIIRHNRILAYTILSQQKDTSVRAIALKQNTVSPINSRGFTVGYGFSNQTFLTYNPIYYGEYDSFGDLEVKKLNCLASRFIINPNQPPLFELTLGDISNISQSNIVINTYSWKLNSSLAYQKSFLTNQSIELGRTYPYSDQGIAVGFLGLNFANYDYLTERAMATLKLTPSVSLGLDQILIPDTLTTNIAYEYRFNHPYLTVKFTLKALNFFHQLAYVQSKDFEGVKFSISSIFN
ncbi:MAG: DUF4105 domain-containing protein, partial [Candidatus Margulisbacteria bacterium]|nr:DUF4105 domain-containing protein [Candidatus Margulisiibacteriota bacterium]